MKHKNTAYIDSSALVQNFNKIKDIVGKVDAVPKVISVVKADAYGHGVDTVAKLLGDAGCDFFAVSSEEEADELRGVELQSGRKPDILILGHIDPENVGFMLEDDIICTVVSADDAKRLSRAVYIYNEENHTKYRLRVHVKLDTGMNRVGFAADSARQAETVNEIIELSKDENLSLEGIFTHFSCADDELLDRRIMQGVPDGTFEGHTAMQLKRYKSVVEALESAGVNVGIKHAANSAAILGLPEAYFDAVRAGVILYGLMPNGAISPDFRPVMRFESTVTHLHVVKAGDRISYGGTYIAERDMIVATVAAGYADGFERAFTGCSVKIGDKMYRQVGRICMDQFMADVTPTVGESCKVKVGDRVTLFGGDDGTMVNTLAKLAGTINYEVVCQVSKRVVRESCAFEA